ncbi:isoprenylcysteine carboxylmethyltransferase family protein [Shewanella sp. MBTL60-112-B2]|uniref:methyltransferase family protein n=1 Tax=Shewanella sp. MBTL60-112-B2 TaxID=2815917 RepID=UPI0035B5260D
MSAIHLLFCNDLDDSKDEHYSMLESKLENKIPPPIVTVIFAFLMWAIVLLTSNDKIISDTTLLGIKFIATGLFLFLGIFSAIAGVVSFKQAKTTVNPLKPDTASALVTSGMFNCSRNPMYLGMALSLCAWACYLASLWSLLGIVGFMLYMQRFQIAPEERALEGIFGQTFIDYKKRVRPWI